MDIGPGGLGGDSLGANDGRGHARNPVTGRPYAANVVKRCDWTRVIAEFRADGPDSEDPARPLEHPGQLRHRSPAAASPARVPTAGRRAALHRRTAIARQTGIRDYIGGEEVLEPRTGALGFLATYLSVTDYYMFRSEAELGKGHADIALEPLVARYRNLTRGYLIELKYRARSESADQAAVTSVVEEAQTQLLRYLADERLARQFPGVRFTGLIVVFHGWEMVYCDAVQR